MSKDLESKVWKSNLKAELKPLAAVMADMGNDDGLGIYPSVEYLAWLLGRSERSIQTSLKELGHIGVVQRLTNHQGGRHRKPQYRLHVKNLPERPSWEETRKGAESSPFVEKGAVHDMERVQSATTKGANLSRKGANSAPDPLEEPSVLEPSVDPPHRGTDFLGALRAFENSRKNMKKPITPEARKILYKKLSTWDEQTATEALENSVMNRWQGVFEPKRNGNGQSNRSNTSSTFEFEPAGRIA